MIQSTSTKVTPSIFPITTPGQEVNLNIAQTITKFILEKVTQLFFKPIQSNPQLFLEENAIVYDPDVIEAKKYSWAVKSYEKIFERSTIIASPGPGNGYFDTVQMLLEQIEYLSRKLQLSNEIDRSSFYDCIEKLFPGAPALTRTLYPTILYFIALRLKQYTETTQHVPFKNDFWLTILNPSRKLIFHANCLIAATNNMFHSLRYGYDDVFKFAYPEFEKHWHAFFEEFQINALNPNCCVCPDLEIQTILKTLVSSDLYKVKKESARKTANFFDQDQYKVVLTLVKYPNKLVDTAQNKNAYIHALELIKLASKTLVSYVGDFCHEVTILEFPSKFN